MSLPVRTVQLSMDAHGSGLFCGPAGLTLNGHPLLKKTDWGFAPRTLPELQGVFDANYGKERNLKAQNYLPGLVRIARSLSADDLPLAMISSLLLKLPETSGDLVLPRHKADFEPKLAFDNTQPRDEDGRWTRDGDEAREPPVARIQLPKESPVTDLSSEAATGAEGSSLARLAPRTLGLLGRFAAAIPDAVALGVGMVLIPTNKSNIRSGNVPGFPGLSYYSDEGIVILSRRDESGQILDVYRGFPDAKGFYRSQKGDIIGRRVGDGYLFDNEALSQLAARQEKTPEIGAVSLFNPAAASSQEDNEPRLCPPPTPEDITKRSIRSLAYQNQITGLPIGWDVLYRGTRFDGCVEETERMQEAKGLMGDFLTTRTEEQLRALPFYSDIMEQGRRQNEAAVDRGVDWYFADEKFADLFEKEFRNAGFSNIVVHYREAIVKKIEECMALVKANRDKWTTGCRELARKFKYSSFTGANL